MAKESPPERSKYLLRFHDAELEHEFAVSHNTGIRKHLRSGIVQAIFIWLAGCTTLFFIAPWKFDGVLIAAMIGIYSLFGFIIWGTYQDKLLLYYDRFSMLSNACAGLLVVITFKGLEHGDIMMLPTLIFNVFFGSYMLRLRLTSSIIASLIYLSFYFVYIVLSPELAIQTKVVLGFLTILTQIFAVSAAYITESTSRSLFISKRTIKAQQTQVEQAYAALEIKNHEIMDSIIYAKRIQSAILPPDRIIKEYLPDSFVLYKPKDIIAGDFYWLREMGDTLLFAAADCTGHGVPGAMVSVICHSGLNSAVRDYHLQDPGQILDKTRELVIEEFEKSDEEVKDGMDIALCALKGKTMKFAGANNPLWIVRDGELVETLADKQPVGKFYNAAPYTTHEIQLQPGDAVYVFSDGYVDQFGGPREKKFKTKQLKEVLLSIQDHSMEHQKEILDQRFLDWKGDFPQVDDVCLMGVRI